MKKLLVLIGVGLCLCGSVMAEGTPEQVEEVLVGATYLDFTSNNASDSPAGPYIRNGLTMATDGDSWGYPDTSDSAVTIHGNCLDDKGNSAIDFAATITGLAADTSYEVYVVSVGKPTGTFDFEWGISQATLEPFVINNATAGAQILVDGGGVHTVGVPIGTFTSDATGQLVFWFGSNGGSGTRTELDGIAIGESINVYYLNGGSDLIAAGAHQMTLDAGEPMPESVTWTLTSGPATVVPAQDGDILTYSAIYTVGGDYVYEVEAQWAGGTVTKTATYEVAVVDPTNNTMLAHWDFEGLPDPNDLIDIANGYDGVFSGGGDDGEPNVVSGHMSATAGDFLGNSLWTIADPYAADPNFTHLSYGLTVASWLKVDNNNVWARLLTVEGAFDYGVTNGGSAWFWMNGTNYTWFNIVDGNWHFFAVVVDPVNGEIKFHIDGRTSGALEIDKAKLFDISDTAGVLIGNRADLARAFPGACDDLKVYNYALTDAELTVLALEGDLPPIVNAGDNQDVQYSGEAVQLNGELVHDDGVPAASTLAWTVVSVPAEADPADVVFSATDIATPTVTFPLIEGEYTLRLSAFDTVAPVVDEVVITINLPSCQDVIDAGLKQVADISGPEGEPDCRVNIHDFAAIALSWLNCVDPQDSTCDWPFPTEE